MLNNIFKTFLMISFLIITQQAYGQNWPDFPNGQNNDPVWGNLSDKVWHKNMELVLPVNFSAPFDGEQFSTGYIKYLDALDEPQRGQFVLVAVSQYDFHGEVGENQIINHNDTNQKYYVGPSRIQVFDVTNPRTACIALEIMLKNDPNNTNNPDDDTTFTQRGTYYTFKNTSIWVDEDGHTFLAANVQEKDGVLVDDKGTPSESDDIYSRVLIIDLTAALSKVRASGATSNVIIIGDATDRNSAYVRGASTTTFSDVYIGYIERDDEHFTKVWTVPAPFDPGTNEYYKKPVAGQRCQIHTMTVDQRSSVLSINPLDFSETRDINPVDGAFSNVQKHGFVDLYLMNTIKGHMNFSSGTAFVEPTRITTSNGKPICVDVVIGTDTYYTMPHEAHAHSMKRMLHLGTHPNHYMIPHATIFSQDTIMLNVASFANSEKFLEANSENGPIGGGVIFHIHWYGVGPGNATVTQEQYWGYGDDRSRPNEKEHPPYSVKSTDDVDWRMASSHTLGSFHINQWTHLFLTANEMVHPSTALKNDGGLTFLDPSSTMTVNTDSDLITPNKWGYEHDYSGNIQWGHYTSTGSGDDYVVDDRRLGNYLKVWGSKHHMTMLGEGSNDVDGGPVGSYESHEIMPTTYQKNGRNAAFTNSQIDPLYTNLDANNSALQPGIGGAHHFNSAYGVTGIYFDDSVCYRDRN